MRILLTGASGFVGSHLLHALQKNSYSVTVCTHRKHVGLATKTHTITVDFMQLQRAEDWIAHLEGVDVVINSVGIIAESSRQSFEMLHHQSPAALFHACEIAGVQRVIQISALGADETAVTPYHLSKKSADDVLRNSSLDWFILRPSLIYGRGGKSSALFQKLSNLPIIPLLDEGQQMIQPVHISDVVATVLRCLDVDVTGKQTIDVVGEKAVSYKDWLLTLRQKKSKPFFLKIPTPLIMRLSQFGRIFKSALFNPDNIYMLQQNNVADSTKLTHFLGRKPLSNTSGEHLK